MSEEPEALPHSAADGRLAPRLPFARIADVEKLPATERWLVDGFLMGSSITVLASTRKAGKTWVALALAVGVASGTPALGRFHVPTPGPVLLFPAEDDPRAIRERIESLCLGADVSMGELPIHIITADQLRLDQESDREKLEELLEHLRPKLLVLDPLVRLHSGAESYSGHVAELFRFLRSLQRRFEVAILLTHHVAKNRSGSTQPGAAMRGSSDLHAVYDHGALLQRLDDGSVLLSIEHRSAPSPEAIAFRLVSRPDGATSFDIIDEPFAEDAAPRAASQAPRLASQPRPAPAPLQDLVLQLLKRTSSPLSQVRIRRALGVRNETLTAVLRELEQQGRVQSLGRMKGWALSPNPPEDNHNQVGRRVAIDGRRPGP